MPKDENLPMTAAHSLLQPCTGSASRDCKYGRAENGCEDCQVRLFSVCGALEACELDELDRISQGKIFAPKTMLFDQGAIAGSVFNVTEGVVRLYKGMTGQPFKLLVPPGVEATPKT